MAFEGILRIIQKFYPNRLINECARKNLAKIQVFFFERCIRTYIVIISFFALKDVFIYYITIYRISILKVYIKLICIILRNPWISPA